MDGIEAPKKTLWNQRCKRAISAVRSRVAPKYWRWLRNFGVFGVALSSRRRCVTFITAVLFLAKGNENNSFERPLKYKTGNCELKVW